MNHSIRWGILGTANIADAFVRGVRGADAGVIAAVAGRDPGRTKAWADERRIPRAFDSHDALLDSGGVDLVYNPLPNNLHAQWTIRALEAGLPVLCEKPLAATAAEARRVAEVAARTGLPVLEGFMYRHHPVYDALFERLRAGAIGEVVAVHSRFSFFLDDRTEIPASGALAGGALRDVGCYCVHLSRWIAGCEPVRVHAFERRTTVDDTMVGALDFPGGMLASFETSIAAAEDQRAEILGTTGSLVLPSPWHPGEKEATLLLRRWGEPDEVIRAAGADPYGLQAGHFADVCAGRAEALWPIADAVANMAAIDALFESARSGRAAAVTS